MDINATFSQARELARQGNRPAARQMLEEILQEDPNNEDVLLWHALVAPDKAEVIEGLKKVLEVNPLNAQAQQRLAKLEGSSVIAVPAPAASQPFSYEEPRKDASFDETPAVFTTPEAPVQSETPLYTPPSTAPAAASEAAQPSVGSRDGALVKRLDHLISLQEQMDQKLKKINRVVQFFFWLAIISLALTAISFCLALAGVIPLLNSASSLIK
jgi:hypothetical protein